MSQTLEAGVAPPPASPDERVARRSALARLLTRPEVGALLGAIVIYHRLLLGRAAVPRRGRRSRPSCTSAPPSASWRSRWRC